MTNIRPVNFRPNFNDQYMIDLLLENLPVKNITELVREAILNLAIAEFGEEDVQEYLRRKNAHRIDAEIMREIIRKDRGQ